ncbi:hypothetical protein ACHQM5_014270 [Ranunculus cassubicifolius]
MKDKRCSTIGRDRDKISYMPEPIQSHIVSYLPLKEAIKTSILSRRWREIGSSLSNLDFEELGEDEKVNKDIIDQTLFLHNGSDIRRFKLIVDVGAEYVSPIHLNRWVSFALRHNVAELSLTVSNGELELLPLNLFTCRSLTTLDLYCFSLKLPSAIHFPLLKKLTLIQMTFCDENLANKLFTDTSCPLLENLEISNCNLDLLSTLSITCTNLKYLKLLDNRHLSDDTHDHDIEFNLSNPNLHEIWYESNRLPQISVGTLSSLLIATFELYSPPSGSAAMENIACKILMGMHNVRKVRLRCYFIQWLTSVLDLPTCLPTSYGCLKSLRLVLDPTKNQLQVVKFLLGSYPNLQKLYLHFYEEDCTVPDMMPMDAYWKSKEFSTVDVLNHLETVEFDNIRGSESELELVSYLLDNASILEWMNITFLDKEITLETRMHICQKLLTLPRVSPRARIFLS